MHYYKHLISFCCFLALFSCNEEQKTVFLDTNYTTQSNSIVQVNIPQANGNNSISNPINSEIQKIIISALQIGNPDEITSSSIKESIDSFNEEYQAFKNDFPESDQPWEAQIDGEIMYQSTELISIAITTFTNTGGAQGELTISFLNFDANNGKRIQTNNLFDNVEAFKTLAKSYFKETTEDETVLSDNDEFKLPANIGYSEEGVVLLYNTYEIAPYASDIVEFVIPFSEVESYLNFH
ncbi:PdaC/SigV domain-containing protein [Algibacter sp.]|uniref:DUF3298 and DUF4163 domain-containing protein n=1 Tax=Algibacter sp. TaxID=1872428 RepID=UPI003C77CDBD